MAERRKIRDLPRAEREIEVMRKCSALFDEIDAPAKMRVANWLTAQSFESMSAIPGPVPAAKLTLNDL